MKKNLEAEQAVCKTYEEVYHSYVCGSKTYKTHLLFWFHPLLHAREHRSVYLVTLRVKMLMYGLYPVLPPSYTENTEK